MQKYEQNHKVFIQIVSNIVEIIIIWHKYYYFIILYKLTTCLEVYWNALPSRAPEIKLIMKLMSSILITLAHIGLVNIFSLQTKLFAQKILEQYVCLHGLVDSVARLSGMLRWGGYI